MRVRRRRLLLLAIPVSVFVTAGTAYQASNTVDPSYAGTSHVAISVPTNLSATDKAKINVAQASGPQGYYHFTNLSAALTSNGTGVSNERVMFTVAGVVVCSATTNSTGSASCPSDVKVDTSEFPSGQPRAFTATFAGDGSLPPASSTAAFSKVTG
ncbi:MAG: hypothetical protein ACRDP1_06525 [Nocardioidaceae bacterium]